MTEKKSGDTGSHTDDFATLRQLLAEINEFAWESSTHLKMYMDELIEEPNTALRRQPPHPTLAPEVIDKFEENWNKASLLIYSTKLQTADYTDEMGACMMAYERLETLLREFGWLDVDGSVVEVKRAKWSPISEYTSTQPYIEDE